ncbi:MAG: hypothetical protein ACRDV3_05360 [Acidothermaceae bacterium]
MATGLLWLGVGPGDAGLLPIGDPTGDGGGDATFAAADAEFWLSCADTPACETTRGVEPATSWPTRFTAVNVTAVTSAHDMIQPMASVTGRVDQLRGLSGFTGDAAARRRRLP